MCDIGRDESADLWLLVTEFSTIFNTKCLTIK